MPLAVVRVAVVVLVAGDVAVVWDVLIDVVESVVVLVDIVVEFEGSSFAVKYGKFKLDLILIDYNIISKGEFRGPISKALTNHIFLIKARSFYGVGNELSGYIAQIVLCLIHTVRI